ncbi:MAG: hypothetical protein ACYDH9_08145 [Limisphaerales bacterium]
MTDPTAAQFGNWFQSLALLFSVIANVGLVVTTFRTQKRRVSIDGELVTKAECDRRSADEKDARRGLYARLTAVEVGAGSMGAALSGLDTRLTLMDGKLDRLIERNFRHDG